VAGCLPKISDCTNAHVKSCCCIHRSGADLRFCNSSVATVWVGAQGSTRPFTVNRHGYRIRANPTRFLGRAGVGGNDSSPPDLLADGEGWRKNHAALPFPINPTPASAVRATSPVCPPILKSWLRHCSAMGHKSGAEWGDRVLRGGVRSSMLGMLQFGVYSHTISQ